MTGATKRGKKGPRDGKSSCEESEEEDGEDVGGNFCAGGDSANYFDDGQRAGDCEKGSERPPPPCVGVGPLAGDEEMEEGEEEEKNRDSPAFLSKGCTPAFLNKGDIPAFENK